MVMVMTTKYTVVESVPSAEDFCRLRSISGLSARPLEAARVGLPRSCYGVQILWQGVPVGMGRIVGDGALNFEIVDIAVDPAHQGRGLGRIIMENIIGWTATLIKALMSLWWLMYRNSTRSSVLS